MKNFESKRAVYVPGKKNWRHRRRICPKPSEENFRLAFGTEWQKYYNIALAMYERESDAEKKTAG